MTGPKVASIGKGRYDQRGVPKARIDSERKARLESEFQRSPDWSVQHMASLSAELDLSYKKIYKWIYDRRKLEVKRL